MLDLHGEYGHALKENGNVYKINADTSATQKEQELNIPFWALNFDELCEICFETSPVKKTKT